MSTRLERAMFACKERAVSSKSGCKAQNIPGSEKKLIV